MAWSPPWAPLGWKQCATSRSGCWWRSPASPSHVLLIMMQLGFRSALFESTLRFHERFRYDIALFSPDSVFIVRPAAFSIRRLYQAGGHTAVDDVSPVYIFPAVWKRPLGHGPARHPVDGRRPDQGTLFIPTPGRTRPAAA